MCKFRKKRVRYRTYNMNIGAAAFLAGLCILLSGCARLASEEGQENSADKLIGVFVTRQYVDTLTGDQADIEGLVENGRVYGSIERGNGGLHFCFGELEGLSLGCVTADSPKDAYAYDAIYYSGDIGSITEYLSDGISEVSNGISDKGATLSGTIYFDASRIGSTVHYDTDEWKELYDESEITVYEVVDDDGEDAGYDLMVDGEELLFYLNSVYQTGDGSVYLVPGTGVNGMVDGTTGMSVSEDRTVTENGKETAESIEFKVEIKAAVCADRVAFRDYTEAGELLQTQEYGIDELPEELSLKKDRAYTLVTETRKDGSLYYELIRIGDEETSVFIPSENDPTILEKQYISINQE